MAAFALPLLRYPAAIALAGRRRRNFSVLRSITVELSRTGSCNSAFPSCVVTAPWGTRPPPKGALRALINPANTQLVGTHLSYFPRGGPLPVSPPPGARGSSGWGGMDAGDNMLYPMQVVDGLTHMHAGAALRVALSATKRNSLGQRCSVGRAVLTQSFELKHFDVIAHTPTPFWHAANDLPKHNRWRGELIDCYLSSVLAIANCAPNGVEYYKTQSLCNSSGVNRVIFVAVPLLGSGAGGAPFKEAARCAAEAVSLLRAQALQVQLEMRFVLNDADAFKEMDAVFHR
jgi:O-acetyl-ADP-ribose deacetylase (regulator of RNase III)